MTLRADYLPTMPVFTIAGVGRRCLPAAARTAPTLGSGASTTSSKMVRRRTEVTTHQGKLPGSMPT